MENFNHIKRNMFNTKSLIKETNLENHQFGIIVSSIYRRLKETSNKDISIIECKDFGFKNYENILVRRHRNQQKVPISGEKILSMISKKKQSLKQEFLNLRSKEINIEYIKTVNILLKIIYYDYSLIN